MRRLGLGLVAALLFAVLAPATVISATKAAAPAVSADQRKAGMAAAPALAQAAGLPCQVTDARFVGKSEDRKAKTTVDFYEVACQQGMGYVLQSPAGGTPSAFTCVEADTVPEGAKAASLPCILPANLDPKAAVAQALAKQNVQCAPEAVRGIGQSKSGTYMEIACQGGVGYILVASVPFDMGKPIQAQNCLNFDDGGGNIKCILTPAASRLAVVDGYVASSKVACTVKERRFVGTATDNANFFEVACQEGKGYILKVAADGVVAPPVECARAQAILGGCQLTDARQAETEQAGLYTRLAKAAGTACTVTKYAVFPSPAGQDVVELVCSEGTGGVGVFKTAGKSEVLDCGHALVAGYKCGLNKAGSGYDALTADLKKLNPTTTCVVSNSRLAAKTAKGTLLLEVACADGLKGYMVEYNPSPVSAVSSTGCVFAGNCKLPGNT